MTKNTLIKDISIDLFTLGLHKKKKKRIYYRTNIYYNLFWSKNLKLFNYYHLKFITINNIY